MEEDIKALNELITELAIKYDIFYITSTLFNRGSKPSTFTTIQIKENDEFTSI